MTPITWVGAPAQGGLVLPSATPTPSHLYGPRGVYLGDEGLVVADSGNHRVLIWHTVPTRQGVAADVVLGQPDAFHEGPRAAGRGPANGFHLPTGVLIVDGRLVLADAWHHRLLVWTRVPTASDTPPDYALGQADLHAVGANRGNDGVASGLYWPFGIAWIGGMLLVADTGNRRVVGWRGVPEADRPFDLLIGQATPLARDENRGGRPNARSFRWPHAIAGSGAQVFVADAGNHRILGWRPMPGGDADADLVLGQADFEGASEFPYTPQSATALRFPYGIASDARRLAVADTANNRVLVWNGWPQASATPADLVIGQPDFAANGENRWTSVADDTFCWPYGISLHRDRMAVADSGNNRVMIWDLAPAAGDAPDEAGAAMASRP